MPDTDRKVTEADFRRPEFRNADPKDFEFRHDGEIVRRDRWESAVQSIRHLVGLDGREFEIADVVEAVRRLAGGDRDWASIVYLEPSDIEEGSRHVLRLEDGSILRNAVWSRSAERSGWTWQGRPVSDAAAFREEDPEPEPDAALLGRRPSVLWRSETLRDGTRTRMTLAVDVVRLVLVRAVGDARWKGAEAVLELSKTFDALWNATASGPDLDEEAGRVWQDFKTAWEPIEEKEFHLAAAFDFGRRFFVVVTSGGPRSEVLLGCAEEMEGSWSSEILARICADDLKGRRR